MENNKIKLENTKSEIIGIYDENDNYVGKDTRKNMRKNNLIHRSTDIVVLNDNGEILVQTRALTKEYCPGFLEGVVGGVVGDGEDANLCAEREIGEEIGIDVNNIKEKLSYKLKHFVQEDICKVWSYCYLLKLNEEEVKSINFKDKEISSIEWIPKDELLKMLDDPKYKITEGSKQTIRIFSSKGII